jgi:hypothetical protein
MNTRQILIAFGCLAPALAQPALGDVPKTSDPLQAMADAVPTDVQQCDDRRSDAVRRLVPQTEGWAAASFSIGDEASDDEILSRVRRLVDAKSRVDDLLDGTLAIRTQFVQQPPGAERREAIRHYLACTAALTDLSGRLRYLSTDVIGDAAYLLAADPGAYERLIDLLVEGRSSIGAAVVVGALFDYFPDCCFPARILIPEA